MMQITDTIKCPYDEEAGDQGICTALSRKKYQFCASKYDAFTINKPNKVIFVHGIKEFLPKLWIFQKLSACNTRGGPVYRQKDSKIFLVGLMPRDNVFEFIPSN